MQSLLRRWKIFACGVVAGILLAGALLVGVGLSESSQRADIIVVPGNAVKLDSSPSPRLQSRLDAALKLFQNGQAPIIFVSGGTGKEGYDEAASMFAYLVKHGVPPNAIVKDGLGIDTAYTAKNAATYMRTNGLKTALIATQYFHVARTKLALEQHGIQVVGSAYGRYFELRDFYSVPRELLAYCAYIFKHPGTNH